MFSLAAFGRVFPGKFKFWSLHCLINAMPSYLIAVIWLNLGAVLTAHLAMLSAVITFIFGYAILTSLIPVLGEGKNLFTRALKVGLTMRLVISILTMVLLPTGSLLLLSPDTWSGMAASWAVSQVFGTEHLGQRVGSSIGDAPVGFWEIYATTLLEGLILSFLLFVLSFIAIIILQAKDRKNPAVWNHDVK